MNEQGKCRKKIERTEKIADMRLVDYKRRGTLRSLSCAVEIPLTSLWRLLKNYETKRHFNSLKPLLKEDNKVARLNYCMSFVKEHGEFEHLMNYINIDENGFISLK